MSQNGNGLGVSSCRSRAVCHNILHFPRPVVGTLQITRRSRLWYFLTLQTRGAGVRRGKNFDHLSLSDLPVGQAFQSEKLTFADALREAGNIHRTTTRSAMRAILSKAAGQHRRRAGSLEIDRREHQRLSLCQLRQGRRSSCNSTLLIPANRRGSCTIER